MRDGELTEPQLQWAIEQQQLAVEAADAKLRRAERMLTRTSTPRAAAEAHNRADAALLDVEMAEDYLRQLQHRMATAVAAPPSATTGRRTAPGQGTLFDVG